jgi:hypothetical protein
MTGNMNAVLDKWSSRCGQQSSKISRFPWTMPTHPGKSIRTRHANPGSTEATHVPLVKVSQTVLPVSLRAGPPAALFSRPCPNLSSPAAPQPTPLPPSPNGLRLVGPRNKHSHPGRFKASARVEACQTGQSKTNMHEPNGDCGRAKLPADDLF